MVAKKKPAKKPVKKAAKKKPAKKRTQPKGFQALVGKKVSKRLAKARDKAMKNITAAKRKAEKSATRPDSGKITSKKIEKIVRDAKKKASAIDIGASVRHFREKLGLSTTALAKKAGISQAQISRLENNQQGFRSPTLIKIAGCLKVRPWVLFMTDIEKAAAAKAIGLGA